MSQQTNSTNQNYNKLKNPTSVGKITGAVKKSSRSANLAPYMTDRPPKTAVRSFSEQRSKKETGLPRNRPQMPLDRKLDGPTMEMEMEFRNANKEWTKIRTIKMPRPVTSEMLPRAIPATVPCGESSQKRKERKQVKKEAERKQVPSNRMPMPKKINEDGQNRKLPSDGLKKLNAKSDKVVKPINQIQKIPKETLKQSGGLELCKLVTSNEVVKQKNQKSQITPRPSSSGVKRKTSAKETKKTGVVLDENDSKDDFYSLKKILADYSVGLDSSETNPPMQPERESYIQDMFPGLDVLHGVAPGISILLNAMLNLRLNLDRIQSFAQLYKLTKSK